jgi:predicted nuclease of predicted toxin-antitoxin system
MKLLFDANLSPSLATSLQDIFPGSDHVFNTKDLAEDDRLIWKHALEGDFAIVTKDSDFEAQSSVASVSPKIVWIRRGNCNTATIEQIIRTNQSVIESLDDPNAKLTVVILL